MKCMEITKQNYTDKEKTTRNLKVEFEKFVDTL